MKLTDRQINRSLEMLPGFVSWNLILFPIWGAFVWPLGVAYFVLLFNVFWLYKSTGIAVFAIVSHLRIQAAVSYNWMAQVKNIKNWHKVRHIVIIPTYK